MSHPKEFAQGLSIGIIMDGNGRWAKQRGLPRTAGHKKGAEVFDDIANYCDELGVESVYFYAFSTENWKRPLEEVNGIMRLLGEYLIRGFQYGDRNIRIRFLGDRTALDPWLQERMNKLEQDSAHKTGMTLNVAVNYGGRQELVRAARSLAEQPAHWTRDRSRSRPCLTICILPGKKTRISSCVPAEKSACPTLCSGRRPIRSWWRWMSSGRTLPGRTWIWLLRSSIGAPAALAGSDPAGTAAAAGRGCAIIKEKLYAYENKNHYRACGHRCADSCAAHL